MKCLFCKQNSQTSKSIEHIIPESLGNKRHILPTGMVCDNCNNYFAVKIEKDLLEQPYFKSLRHRNDIVNKRGRYIPEKGFISHPQGGAIDVYKEPQGLHVNIDNARIFNLVLNGEVNKLYLPFGEVQPEANNLILSRFLAKVAVEAMLYKLIDIEGWIEEVMTKPELDLIKNYSRYGTGVSHWEYSQRILYSEDQGFIDSRKGTGAYQILHEFDFFWTKEMEFYFVIAILGIEYAINLANPSIETYRIWLQENDNKSILEDDREKRI